MTSLPWPAGDPWESYAGLHEQHPPLWFDGDLGAWVVIGHAAASQVLRGSGWSSDPSLAASFAALASSIGIDARALGQLLIFTDPPEHTRVRRSVQPPFGSRPVGALRPRVRAIAAAAVAGIGSGEEVDLMRAVARPVPLAVIGELFDLPPEVVGLLSEESPALVRILDIEATSVDLAAAAGAFTGLLLELLPLASERRNRPGPDVLSWIASDETLALEEVVFAALLLAIAGHETTANLVGSVVAAGASGGDGWADAAVRRYAPVQAVVRVATEQHHLEDAVIEAGDQVTVGIAAANRDPRAEPGSEALSFGMGRHHCLGARLAMVELEEIIAALGPVEATEVVWNSSRAICGPQRLMVRFTPT